MKIWISLLALLALPAFAAEQNSNSVSLKKPSISERNTAAEGLRAAVIIPAWEFSKDVGGLNKSSRHTGVDHGLGAWVGYAHLPMQQWGWIAGGSLIQASALNDDYLMLRGDGSLAYTFPNRMNVKAGLNINKFVRGDHSEEFPIGIGYQFGVGAQFTRKIGADFMIAHMNQSGTWEGASRDLTENGVELGVNATF